MGKSRLNKDNSVPFRPEEYSYTILFSPEDNVFVGRVAEFESLAAHGETPGEALDEITAVVGFVLQDLEESGEFIPEPFSRKHFSGKLNVRMSETLHRSLAFEAARQGVSLNQLINQKLSSAGV